MGTFQKKQLPSYALPLSITAAVAVVGIFSVSLLSRGSLLGQLLPAPIPPSAIIVDDADAGRFKTAGTWVKTTAGYRKGSKIVKTGSYQPATLQTATWIFSTQPGTYDLYTTWIGVSSFSKNVQYRLLPGDAPEPLLLTAVDQSKYPSGPVWAKSRWQFLGRVTITGGAARLVLSNYVTKTDAANARKGVMADAALLLPVVFNGVESSASSSSSCPNVVCPFGWPTDCSLDHVYDANGCLVACPIVCPSSSSSSSAEADTVTMNSIDVQCDKVTVQYGKNFDTCAHMQDQPYQLVHTNNVFCQNNGPVTVPLAEFNDRFRIGGSFKLCHGNNANICSGYVTVTGTTACAPVCGDGTKAVEEACDDGNPANDDGCSAQCTLEPQVLMRRALDNNGDGVLPSDEIIRSLQAFGLAFGKAEGEAGYVGAYDVDGSKTVGTGDYSYIGPVIEEQSADVRVRVFAYLALDGNGDFVVSSSQEVTEALMGFTASFLKTSEMPGFNRTFDVDKNGIVDQIDLLLIAQAIPTQY